MFHKNLQYPLLTIYNTFPVPAINFQTLYNHNAITNQNVVFKKTIKTSFGSVFHCLYIYINFSSLSQTN